MSHSFVMPRHIVSGTNALEEGKALIGSLGKKALVVTDEFMIKLGNLKYVTDVLEDLGVGYTVFSGITGEPTDRMIEEGYRIYVKENCDFLVALGGGSPIDSMKAIGAIAGNGGKITDYLGKIIEKPCPGMVAIPTTAGTGSEATQFTIITDTERDIKMLLKGAVLMPSVALIDPRFTMTAPPKITAATGLDALCHAAEAYTSRRHQPLSDIFALSAVEKIFKYLPIAFKDGSNVEAREQMSIAALEAGIAFNNSSVTVIHGMSRPIGALFHVAHGISNAMLIKECFTYVLDGAYDRFGDLGRRIGAAKENDSDEKAAGAFLDKAVELVNICEIPSLEEYGIPKAEFEKVIDKMSEDAMFSGSPSNTMKELGIEDIKNIYGKLY